MRFVCGPAAAALVIPTWNRRSRLMQTLDAIEAIPGPDVEVIIADNASSDGTPDAVRDAHPDARLIVLPDNIQSAARLEAARAALSPILIQLDDDSVPEPGCVEGFLDAFRDNRLGIAAAFIRLADGSWEEGGAHAVHIGCGAAMRRDDFVRLGGYPPFYGTYVEEYDFAYRVIGEGRSVRYVGGCRVAHFPQARSSFDFMVEKLTANNIYLGWKFYPDEDAKRFEDWTLRRYRLLAEQKGARDGFTRALASRDNYRRKAAEDRVDLPEHALDRILPYRLCRSWFASRPIDSPVTFLRAGKEIAEMIRAARDAGCVVEAILDEGLLSLWPDIDGVPIRPFSHAANTGAGYVIGGMSPGFVANTRTLAARLGIGDVLSPIEVRP